MKIAIIGSTEYKPKMLRWAKTLRKKGHKVRIPAFDNYGFNAYEVCEYNRELILWSDEIHMFWNKRSVGALFDFGMVFMARKPFKVIYLGEKTFDQVMSEYERRMK